MKITKKTTTFIVVGAAILLVAYVLRPAIASMMQNVNPQPKASPFPGRLPWLSPHARSRHPPHLRLHRPLWRLSCLRWPLQHLRSLRPIRLLRSRLHKPRLQHPFPN